MEISIFDALAILTSIAFGILLGYTFAKLILKGKFQSQITKERKEAIEQSRLVLSGQFSEQIAPYLPDFPFKPTECKFLGKPIDFIVFKGMDEKNIDEVVFVEVKSGKSKVNTHERKLKDAVDKKKVKWVEYRVPEEVTKKVDK